MEREVTVEGIRSDGRRIYWTIRCEEKGDRFILEGYGSDAQQTRGEGDDWFDALRDLRIKLEKGGSFLLCAGSARAAHQSGMLASIDNGSLVYILEAGRRPELRAWIFDPVSSDEVSTVAEQDEFFERWIRSRQNNGLMAKIADELHYFWGGVKEFIGRIVDR